MFLRNPVTFPKKCMRCAVYIDVDLRCYVAALNMDRIKKVIRGDLSRPGIFFRLLRGHFWSVRSFLSRSAEFEISTDPMRFAILSVYGTSLHFLQNTV